MTDTHRRARRAAILLGMGLGAFADGIVLHQIAQWHAMLSSRIPPVAMDSMRANMTADGWFHAVAWLFTIAGAGRLYLTAHAGHPVPHPRAFVGLGLLGWGGFNLTEGIVSHHLLELHHVRELPVFVPAWDWIFLAVGGGGLMLAGWLLARTRG